MAHLRARPVAAAPTLSQRQLNRAVLARQLLLERADTSIPEALELIGGIQNQYAPNAYIRLWSCLRAFRRADLDVALERRDVIQATLMRQTIHLVSRADYWPLEIAIRRHRREWFARVQKSAIGDTDMRAVAAAASHELARGPRKQRELAAAIGERGLPADAVRWVGEWLDLVRVPPSGTWAQRRADVYGLAASEVGPEPALTETDALAHLLRRYLGAFGPARIADAAAWAGVAPALLKPVAGALELRHFRAEDGAQLLDLPEAPLPDADTPAPVRFLPTWDAALLVHCRRAGIIAEEHRPIIFSTRNPPSSPTFLVDGRVCGTWRYTDGRVVTDPFARLPRSVSREVAHEGERLAALHAE
jgi:hypothetical protein